MNEQAEFIHKLIFARYKKKTESFPTSFLIRIFDDVLKRYLFS